MQRVVSLQKYRRGAIRDFQWLFNSSAYSGLDFMRGDRSKQYPEVYRSVLNYGVRQLCGVLTPDLEKLKEQLAESIRNFEPRMSARSVDVKVDMERNVIRLEINGELWANPMPENLHLATTVDLETGQCQFGDALNG